MKLITNSGITHKSVFKKLLKAASSIYMVTSYADSETLEFIVKRILKNKTNPKVKLILGGNFAITEPDALRMIKKVLPGEVYVAMPEDPVIFQSNIYLFRTKKHFHVFIGSAPFTEEGLEVDMEATVYQKESKKGELWNMSKNHINKLLKSPDVHSLTTLFIARYETYFEELDNKSDMSRSSWHDDDLLINNMEALKSRFKEWKKMTVNGDRVVKCEENYKQARKILNRIASQSIITDEEAMLYLDRLIGTKGEEGYWNVNGLQGSKLAVVNQFDKFRDQVRFVEDKMDEDPGFLFEGCLEYARQIKGIGVNMISEILLSYAPQRFVKLNSGLVQKLVTSGSLAIKKSIAKYNGEDYQKYTEIMWDYAAQFRMKTMVECDLFFNGIIDELDKSIEQTGTEEQEEGEV